MRKKVTAIVIASACALTCAVSLTACGSDEEAKYHSQEQWTAAFSAATTRDCYMFDEGNDTLGYDKNNDYFSYLDSTTDSTGNTTSKSELIFKTGSHYYLTTDHPSDGTPITYEITSTDAASKINGNSLKITAEKLLDLFQSSYAEFSADGTYMENSVTSGICTELRTSI